MVLLPSEKARLVLGYLGEQGCLQAYKEFLLSSPHLRELRGMIRCGVQPHEYEWKMSGLSDILDEYSSIERLVSPLKINSNNFKGLQDCTTILKKIGLLIELARNFADNSNSDPNRETPSVQVESSFEEQSLKPETQLSKLKKSRNKRICSEFVHNIISDDKIESAAITQNSLPIISNIPESLYSDDGADICVSGTSPRKSKSDEIATIINKTQGANICRDTQDQNLAPLDHTKVKNNSKIISTKLDEGLDVSVVKEALLERTDIHEKIAENINKMLSASQKDSSRKDDASGDSKVVSSCSKINDGSDLIDLDDHLNNIIRNIVNITEKDHIFDEFLGELVCKVTNDRSNSSSNEPSSPSRPTTSTPERSCKNDKELDISTSPVEKNENLVCNAANKPETSINEDSIKHRLRNSTKSAIEQNKDLNSETNAMGEDITPQKTQNIDLLAMAINNVDVSGSIRKLNSVNSVTKSDNKLVILSNEVVSRNIADYTCLTSMNIASDNKIENTYQSISTESDVPLNTHFILPSISTSAVNNNIFTNASLPQYLFGNTDTDQGRFYLIGGSTLGVPSQSSVVNNDPSNIMGMPTFIMLPPSTAGVPLNENLDLGYQQTNLPNKPKAVILPQTEIKRGQRKIAPNIKSDPNVIIISEMNTQSNSTNIPSVHTDGRITNTIKKDCQQKDTELVEAVQNNILKADQNIKTSESNETSCNSKISELIRDLSSVKMITHKEDDTPEFSSIQIQKRQSLSTPRRRKSHVRVLDFNTPPKKNIEAKAKTSPKLSKMRPVPKTTEKVSKPPKPTSIKEPVRSILCRSSKSKMIQEEEINKSNTQDLKKSSTVSHSPLPKLKGDWDQVQGITLIVGNFKQDETEIISYKLDDTNNASTKKTLIASTSSDSSELANAAPQAENKNNLTTGNENELEICKRISNNDNIVKKTPPKIRILPKRGEKYDFQPTTSKRGKIKQDMVNASKNRWDFDLRALAICEKTAVHKRNIRLKKTSKKNLEKGPKDIDKDGSFNASVENMEIIAKKLEDALNDTLFQQSSNNSTIENMSSFPDIISEKTDYNQEDTSFTRRSPQIVKVAPSNYKAESSERNIKETDNFEMKQVESIHKKCSNGMKLKPKENSNAKSDPLELPMLDQNNTANSSKPEHISTDNINMKNEVKQQNVNNCIISAETSVAPPVNMESCTDVETREIITDNTKDKSLFSDDKNIITGHNFSDTMLVLDTPFKCDGSMVPKTPRFILPNIVEDTPLVKTSRIIESSSLAKCGIPTPSFPVTPKLESAITPEIKTTENGKESMNNNSGSTYYKPDVSMNINCLLQEERKTNVIKQMSLMQIKDIEKKQCERIVNKNGQCRDFTQIDNNVSDNDNFSNSSISSCNSSSSDNSSTSTSSSSSNDSSTMEKDISHGLLTRENRNENAQQDEMATTKEIYENKRLIDFSKMRHETIVEKSLVTIGQRNSTSTNKLAQELSEKRERILTKVRADLQINSMNYLPKKTRNKNIAYSKNPKTMVKKNCPKPSQMVSKQSISKEPSKLDSSRKTCSSIQSSSQKNLPKTRKLREENSENNSSETRNKVHSDYLNTIIKIDKLNGSQYPLLHISEDESEKSFAFGPDIVLDDILKKSVRVESADIENPCSDQSSGVVNNQLSESTKCSSMTNNEILQNVKEIPTNGIILQSKFTVKESIHSSIDNDGSDDVKKSNDDELYELIIQEQNHIENCFEEQNERKLPNINNDGFDVNSFQINVPDQGILKISPLISLLEIRPKQKQKIKKKDRRKTDSVKDFNNKIKTRKSPLNILFDEIDNPVHEVEMNKFLTKTPCSDLYNDSPTSKYSANKKDSKNPPIKKRVIKAEKSSKRPSIHQKKADIGKAINRLGEENFAKFSTNSSKTGKRKRDNDCKNLFSKKSRSCNPQEILKTVGVDTFLNALHGPE